MCERVKKLSILEFPRLAFVWEIKFNKSKTHPQFSRNSSMMKNMGICLYLIWIQTHNLSLCFSLSNTHTHTHTLFFLYVSLFRWQGKYIELLNFLSYILEWMNGLHYWRKWQVSFHAKNVSQGFHFISSIFYRLKFHKTAKQLTILLDNHAKNWI